jgi:hypothetical protein
LRATSLKALVRGRCGRRAGLTGGGGPGTRSFPQGSFFIWDKKEEAGA